MERDFDKIVESLLGTPYWVIDMLPMQVPQEGGGQFFAVERYYLQEWHKRLCQQFADVLLKLNCYHNLHVNHFDEWVKNPAPATLVEWLTKSLHQGFLWILIDDGNTLITVSSGDTHMTLYNASPDLLELVGKLATSSGLFLWQLEANW